MPSLRHRDKACPKPKTTSFFVSETGIRLTASMVRWNFNKLSCQIGLRNPSDSSGPRIHDMRHTFAVHMMQNWYRQGKNVEKLLPQLAVYLGHRNLNCTYWYMTATPELLKLAAERAAESTRCPGRAGRERTPSQIGTSCARSTTSPKAR